ncbi:hypothetical protein [Campylobacter sp. LR286c]|uniref:hypothetical protein n=1 Tax=Campylobacter sp. LR286c TaxID=2593545 RepID=UPI001237E352|nr:hypothetical protein [Campylobacter sp. LR286c]KAA6229934.1 hypothetical protein FMM57_00145 [Campylobacter sp. LR286c]
MILEFNFEYVSDNDIFEYLLYFYAKNYIFDLEKKNNTYIFKIKGKEEELTKFCQSLNSISTSVFLRNFSVNEGQDFKEKTHKKEFSIFPYLTQLNASAYLEKNILIENEWGVFCKLEFSLNNEFIKLNKENFNQCLENALNALNNNEKIYLKNTRGIYEVSLLQNYDFKDENSFLMACDINTINSVFSCSNDSLKLLASIEKPLIKLKFNALFRQKYKIEIKEFKLKLSQNLFSFVLGQRLTKLGFNFMLVKKIETFENDFELMAINDDILIIKGFEFINQKVKELIFSKEDKNMTRISYILSKFNNPFLIELSQEFDDILLINKKNNILKINLPNNSDEIYKILKSDEISSKLLNNYKNAFLLPNESFNCKNNFFSLFCIIARFLHLDNDFLRAGNIFLNIASNSRLMRGVKIDFKAENGVFNYIFTLRSMMSYKLAGVNDENIIYGTIESLAYFLRDLNDDLFEKKLIDETILSGSLFECKPLLRESLKHVRKSQLSYVPTRIF